MKGRELMSNIQKLNGYDILGVDNYARNYVYGVDSRLTTAEGKISTLEDEMDTAESLIRTLNGQVNGQYQRIWLDATPYLSYPQTMSLPDDFQTKRRSYNDCLFLYYEFYEAGSPHILKYAHINLAVYNGETTFPLTSYIATDANLEIYNRNLTFNATDNEFIIGSVTKWRVRIDSEAASGDPNGIVDKTTINDSPMIVPVALFVRNTPNIHLI